ncbi:MAG: hypothetical protein JJE46_00510 [Acidimicrobiia bacterium]|nr:hypothetical protein [Acidimicrobiia bacterium]
MTRAPRPDGKIVEVANLPTRFEAELAIGFLETAEIQAMGKFGDAGGVGPHYALVDGFRVCVFEEDVDAAREVLEAMDRPDESDTVER